MYQLGMVGHVCGLSYAEIITQTHEFKTSLGNRLTSCLKTERVIKTIHGHCLGLDSNKRTVKSHF
jgi:hypothetical protein